MAYSAAPLEPEEEPASRVATQVWGRSSAPQPQALSAARAGRGRATAQGGRDLYRHLAAVFELGPTTEFLLVPSGAGASALFLAQVSGAAGAAADPDASRVALAQAAAREARLAGRLHFEQAALEDLPYKDGVFDVAIGEIGLGGTRDPASAIAELARVTRPLGAVALLQLTWTRQVEPGLRDAIAESLGARPALLVEWKQMLRDAGVVDLHVEDWSEAAAAFRQPLAANGLGAPGGLRGRLGALFRAWRRWSWGGSDRDHPDAQDLRSLIAEERVLGLSLITGTRWPAQPPPLA